jgi:transcriptional regulator with XRE-family HTH domain
MEYNPQRGMTNMEECKGKKLNKQRTLYKSGDKMKFIREKILICSIEEVAERLGYSDKSSISKIETENIASPNIRSYYMFCGAYNIPAEIFDRKDGMLEQEIENIVRNHKAKTEKASRDEFLDKYIGDWQYYAYTNVPKTAERDIIHSVYKIRFDENKGYLAENIDEYIGEKTETYIDFIYKGTLTRTGLQINMRMTAISHDEEVTITWMHNASAPLNYIVFAVKTAYSMRGNALASKCIFHRNSIGTDKAKQYLRKKELIEIDCRYFNKIN